MPQFEQQPEKAQSGLLKSRVPDRAISQPIHVESPTPAYQPLGNQVAQRFARSCPLRLPSPSLCPYGGACHTCPAPVQAKPTEGGPLKVNKPGDKYEQEADRVADQVMRMPQPRVQRACSTCDEEGTVQTKPLATQITPLVQRQVEPEEEGEEKEPAQAKLTEGTQVQRQGEEPEEEEEEPAQTKLTEGTQVQRQEEEPEEKEKEPIQTKQAGGRTSQVDPNLVTRIHSLRGGGQPLPRSVRSFFEPRFGYDFSQVRVHTDGQAADTAKALKSRAFTRGRDIVFGAGQYEPEKEHGKKLLAHELTHVVQQNTGPGRSLGIQRRTRQPASSRRVQLRTTGFGSWMDAAVLCYYNRRKRWKKCRIDDSGSKLMCACSGRLANGLPPKQRELPRPTLTSAALTRRKTPLLRLDPNGFYAALHWSYARKLFGKKWQIGPPYLRLLITKGGNKVVANWVELREKKWVELREKKWVELSPCACWHLFGRPGVNGPTVEIEPTKEAAGVKQGGKPVSGSFACHFKRILSERQVGGGKREIRVGHPQP